MAKQEFLMLAHEFKTDKSWIGGWYISEKLDGTRAFWDGGISRGKLAREVPYANTAKDGRYLHEPRATGLWSRYGNVIHAPDWFLDNLPTGVCLDGELWMGRGSFQEGRSTVSTLVPGPGWQDVRYMVFDSPPYAGAFKDRFIKTTNFNKSITLNSVAKMATILDLRDAIPFQSRQVTLASLLKDNSVAALHSQTRLPYVEAEARDVMYNLLDAVTTCGGEGLIARAPESIWLPERVKTMLKIKKLSDAEGVVTGYTTGRATDKGSKLLGMMGALVLDFRGKRLELSGFTDAERQFSTDNATFWARLNPGVDAPTWVSNSNFPRGTSVTFRYRELSDDGIPKEARYYRKP
jgi:DNA ligase-1